MNNNIGTCFVLVMSLGLVSCANNHFNSAFSIQDTDPDRAIEMYIKDGSQGAYNNIGSIYDERGDKKTACRYYKISLDKVLEGGEDIVNYKGYSAANLSSCYVGSDAVYPVDYERALELVEIAYMSAVRNGNPNIENYKSHVDRYRKIVQKINHRKTLRNRKSFFSLEERSDGAKYIIIHGDITFDILDRFKEFEKSNKASIVRLNSNGGSFAGGVALGKYLNRRGYATSVIKGDACISACAIIFLAGKKRWLYDGAFIGFHRPYIESKRWLGGSDYTEITSITTNYFRDLKLDKELIDEILTHGKESVFSPSVDELKAYNIVTE